jgi:DNA topoisomerase-3
MTKRLVQKAKEYDRDTMPGNYVTLSAPCPNCSGIVKENYRRYTCTGADGKSDGCGFSFGKTPAGRTFEVAEVEQFLRDRKIGPLSGFRSKSGWPFTAEMIIKFDDESKNYKLEFDFQDDNGTAANAEPIDFSSLTSLGACPKCGAGVFETGKNYVCEKSLPTVAHATPVCNFKSGQIILQQTIEREQMQKLLSFGKTDMLDKFVSTRTRRPFKAMLVWDAAEGKVNFEFAPSKYPPRKTAATPLTKAAIATEKRAANTDRTGVTGTKALKTVKSSSKPVTTKTPPKKTAKGFNPSAALAAVIGDEPVVRTQVIKKLWDYIKAHGLQDARDKRNINADAKLLAVFGKPQVTMFEMTGLVSKHLG